jgi:hypothetical protein
MLNMTSAQRGDDPMTTEELLAEAFEVLRKCFTSLGSEMADVKSEMSPELFAKFKAWLVSRAGVDGDQT